MPGCVNQEDVDSESFVDGKLISTLCNTLFAQVCSPCRPEQRCQKRVCQGLVLKINLALCTLDEGEKKKKADR